MSGTGPWRGHPEPYRRSKSEQRAELLADYDALRAKGFSTTQVCGRLGIASATLYRWLEARRSDSQVKAAPSIDRVSEAVRILCDPNNAGTLARLESIIDFSVWLHWSSKPQYYSLAVAASLASYFAYGRRNLTLSSLSPAERQAISSRMRLDDLIALYPPSYVADLPAWHEYNAYDDPRYLVSEVVEVLIQIGKRKNGRSSASLTKAHYLLCGDYSEKGGPLSRNAFDRRWELHHSAAPFLFIENFHSRLKWSAHPASKSLRTDVDYLLEATDETRRYFGQCLWTIRQLYQVLHSRSISSLRFPHFPENIEPIEVAVGSLSNEREIALIDF